VQYRVTGTARGAEVKYRLPRGSIEQRTVALPFTTGQWWFRVRDSAFIEARNTGASGDLRVEILIEGQPDPLLRSNPVPGPYATNAYGIARASCCVGAR
jgi:hypothetical protein